MHLSAVVPPLPQTAPQLLTGTCMHAAGVVRDLDQRFSESDLRGDPIGVLGTCPVLGRRSEQTHGVARHHPVPTLGGIEVPVEHVDEHRSDGQTHAHVFDRDEPQTPPQVLGDIRRGYEHLVGGEHGVVDATAPDLLLEDRDEIVHRNAMGRNDLRVGVRGEVSGTIATWHELPLLPHDNDRHVRHAERVSSALNVALVRGARGD